MEGEKAKGPALQRETHMDQHQIAYGIKLSLVPLRDALIAVNTEGHRKACPCAEGRAGKGHERAGEPQRGERRRRVETPESQPSCSSPGWSLT